MANTGDIDVDCMKRDCKWNEDAKCRAARILVGMGPECETYEPEALAPVGGAPLPGGLPLPGGGPAPIPGGPAPMARPPILPGGAPAPAPAGGGAPAGAALLNLLAGRGGGGPR